MYDLLAALLRQQREGRKVTQEELSEKLDESKNFAQKNERMERRIDVVEFYRIAKALDLNPVELFADFVEQTEKKR